MIVQTYVNGSFLDTADTGRLKIMDWLRCRLAEIVQAGHQIDSYRFDTTDGSAVALHVDVVLFRAE